MLTAALVRLTTITVATPPTLSQAASTLAFSGILRPPRTPSSAVTTTVDLQSSIRPAIEFRREAAEYHRMDRANARAGENGDRGLRNHRHVDGDTVALLDAARFQHVGETADLGVQLFVGEFLVVFRIVAFPQDGGLVAALGEVAIDAIVAGVQRAILEPFDRDIVRVVGGVLDLAERLDPVDALGLLGPEAVRVLDRTRVHLLILGVIGVGPFAPVGRNVIDFFVGHWLPPVPALTPRATSFGWPLCDSALICDKADAIATLVGDYSGFTGS